MSLKKTYIICATQRSGSTLLCHLLASTGKAGNPKEYLLPTYKSKVPFDEENYVQYVRGNLNAYASENGVSGVKMMENNFSELLERLRNSDEFGAKSNMEIVHDVFPGVQFIFISRKNKVRQAISLSRAEQSDRWEKHSSLTSSTANKNKFAITPFYIKSAINRAIEREEIWKKFFQENGIVPYTINYEELVKAKSSHIHKILEFLEISNAFKTVVTSPTLKKQADFYTEFLIIYYRVYFLLKSLVPDTLWKLARHIKNQYFYRISRI
jgi:LPS sulfotransferase NodH